MLRGVNSDERTQRLTIGALQAAERPEFWCNGCCFHVVSIFNRVQLIFSTD
jgi:hypothetical protein